MSSLELEVFVIPVAPPLRWGGALFPVSGLVLRRNQQADGGRWDVLLQMPRSLAVTLSRALPGLEAFTLLSMSADAPVLLRMFPEPALFAELELAYQGASTQWAPETLSAAVDGNRLSFQGVLPGVQRTGWSREFGPEYALVEQAQAAFLAADQPAWATACQQLRSMPRTADVHAMAIGLLSAPDRVASSELDALLGALQALPSDSA